MQNMVPGGAEKQLSQMRRGAIAYCVLALLRQEARYGFELVRELSSADGLVTSEGTVYPLLSRLRREGLVDTFWQESPHGPPRRYYRITKAGEAALQEFLPQWRRFKDAVDRLVGSPSLQPGSAGPEPAQASLTTQIKGV